MACQNCEELDLIVKFPEKTAELDTYIDSLGLNNDMEHNRGLLIQCLHRAQHIFGYLPLEVQKHVSKKLSLHLSEVYGVISFYHYFTETPVGRYKINVCTGTACFVKGAGTVLEEFKRYLNLEQGETSADRKFSLGGVRCLGACSLAPVVMVNDKVYGNVTPKMVPEIINECK
ncbi:MAG: NAD(P)H-dependent oxidoreductase subunit E [Lentisphaerae bacterium]|jgi:NADH:ubiquinone oxidoreductase subunit E|nr:NAD(P)H-dependent oxidoreductase subunit E [Victivallaceae bacterium]MDD3117148.1 NAD(P)H-dependent oxidoreductase subunit E [Victivallaceae bacterium]MDD3703549.1 NAD(P)H-dependent oxidoreductase subunit E [Victivallaceae bacterium]MDD5664341.1 NAD(P)H-dependent oxidoreductase subunit E [Victivallaceae bacterium]NLK83327.1 NAD(P)H-dependent oxidoreductase subunit E [Lentisphaerota bacterium]